ncbi:hypothetical protein PCI56_02090 [Plesiomonas shigelloides subsp. oncorhynchi]|nr:hypothetical protein [Plesiomonas shigelloides]
MDILMENRNVLSVMISSLFMAGSVHAAISNPTPLVVGHKPTLSFQGTKPVAIQLGDSIVINETDFFLQIPMVISKLLAVISEA